MKVYSVHTPIIHTLLWLAIGVGCLAADIEAPALAPPHTLVDIRAKTEGKGYAWLVLGHEGTPVRVKVDSGDKSQATFTGPPGRYVVWLVVSLQDGTLDQGQVVVVIGSPGPSPPQPEPGPGPVVSGKRKLLIVHESADDTPEVSRLIVSLRSGPARDYLNSKSHTLHILDDDSVDAAGKPSAALEGWRPHFAGMKLPALFVLLEDGRTLVHKQELPAGTTAAQVVEIVKGKGG